MAKAWIETDSNITLSDETLDAIDTYGYHELGFVLTEPGNE